MHKVFSLLLYLFICLFVYVFHILLHGLVVILLFQKLFEYAVAVLLQYFPWYCTHFLLFAERKYAQIG